MADAAPTWPSTPPEPLAKIKLFVPRVRQRSVARPRLLALIDQGVSRKLTLISAPAGSGKTTLLTDWYATEQGRRTPCAWLSLDEADNHPARFWQYVLEAVQRLQPGLAVDLSRLLSSAQPAPVDTIVRLLVNQLAELPDHAVLVLDDYHLLAADEIHQSVALLLELMPPQFHLVITTRVDPPLPLTRLRVRGEMTEVRLEDLRFTNGEAATFLEGATGRRLTDRQVALLEQRTEGWVAGLHMAALSIQGLPDIDPFVQAFAGSHRYIVDYLIDEVLRHQPAEVQTFLLATSILDRLSGPLCDAVTGGSGSQALLEDLERRNLFLIPLDHHRQWYRYHHLFAEVLQSRLQRLRPGEAALLHRRASAWYEAAGLVEPAVNHALAGDDPERAIRLVAATAEQIWHRGDNGILLQWLEALPVQLVRSRPDVLFSVAWACMTSGRLEQAVSLLQAAEELLRPDDPDQAVLLGRVLAVQAHVTRVQLHLPAAVALSHRALSLLAPADLAWRGITMWNLGAVHHWSGELADASARYADAQDLFRAASDLYGLLRATVWQGEILADAGRLPEAYDACQQALAQVVNQGGEHLPVLSLAHLGLGELLFERHELAEAEHHLLRAVELTQSGGLLDVTWLAYIPLALLKQAQGEPQAALAYVQAADDVAPRVPWALAHGVATRVRILLQQGERERAARLAPQLEALARAEQAPMQAAVWALSLLKLAQGLPHEALALLQQRPAPAGQPDSIRTLSLRALVRKAAGDHAGALATLENALALAAPSGNVAVFLELGPPMVALLSQGVSLWKGAVQAQAQHLLGIVGYSPAAAAGTQPPTAPPSAPLVEPPSEREREVLSLLAAGASNEEIARRLFITQHTAKKHVANLLAKLGAANRTQAVALARELGLL